MWFIFFKWGKCSLEKLSDLTNATWQFDNRAVNQCFLTKHCMHVHFLSFVFPLGVWFIHSLRKCWKQTIYQTSFYLDAGNSPVTEAVTSWLLHKYEGQIDILKFNSASFTYWSLEMISFIWACSYLEKGILCIQHVARILTLLTFWNGKLLGVKGRGCLV